MKSSWSFFCIFYFILNSLSKFERKSFETPTRETRSRWLNNEQISFIFPFLVPVKLSFCQYSFERHETCNYNNNNNKISTIISPTKNQSIWIKTIIWVFENSSESVSFEFFIWLAYSISAWGRSGIFLPSQGRVHSRPILTFAKGGGAEMRSHKHDFFQSTVPSSGHFIFCSIQSQFVFTTHDENFLVGKKVES